jgi:signal transduction histidine kinase
MLKLLGRDQQIVGMTFMQAVPELSSIPLMERLTKVYETGETFEQPEEKMQLIRFEQSYTGYYNYTYKALRSVSGDIYGVMATASEITPQVVARKKIEEKEKELRDLIKAAPIGICVLGGSPLCVEEVNERFLFMWGMTREQLKNNACKNTLENIAPISETVLANVIATGSKYTSEEYKFRLVRNGVEESIYATLEYVPVTDIHEKVARIIILAIEVTRQVATRKKIEAAVNERTRELAESNRSLQRSNAELEQFAYIASHDLQEPLRKISTFTQMLERELDTISNKGKEYFTKIYNSTDRMAKLIRDVLAFSQVSHATDSFTTVDLSMIVKTVAEDFDFLLAQQRATFEIGRLPIIQGIPSQLIQLFSNLLSNSLKFARPHVAPVISISSSAASESEISKYPGLSADKSYYCVEFRDNGIGFNEEHTDRIFKIFQRLHGKTEFEGTGIGLSICRKIAETHHGYIAALPVLNGGATFHILLPVGIVEADLQGLS